MSGTAYKDQIYTVDPTIKGCKTEYMVQTQEHTGNILQNYIPETYVILLTNATPINSIKTKMKELS